MNPYHKIRDFTAARALGVGSSDIPVLAGMTAHYPAKEYTFLDGHVEKLRQTPYALYLEKEGLAKRDEAGERADWGHRLEGIVLAKWVEDHYSPQDAVAFLAAKIRGESIGPFKADTEATMPERAYVLAHADLVIDDGQEARGIVEAKTAGLYAGKRKEGQIFLGYDLDDRTAQGIPDPVYLQVQWQMLAYGIPEAWVAVLIDTGDYREYGPIPAAPRVQEKCLALAERFMDCRAAKTPPKPETWSDVASMWPSPSKTTAMVSGDMEMKVRDWAARYWSLGARIDELTEEREELKSAIGIAIGENSYLTAADGTKLASSGVQNNPRGCDLKRLEKEMPTVYKRLVKAEIITQTTRREVRPARIKGE